MNQRGLLFFLGLVSCLLVLGCTRSQDVPPTERSELNETVPDRLSVTIWPKTTRVQIEESFEVSLRVVNATEKPVSFEVFNCSWNGHWQFDNPRLTYQGWDCVKNFPVKETLSPGQAYEKSLRMIVKDGPPLRILSFKMGFTPLKVGITPYEKEKTYWSNTVVLGIKSKPPQVALWGDEDCQNGGDGLKQSFLSPSNCPRIVFP